MKDPSLKTKAYNYIRQMIVSYQFEPGAFLDESELIRQLNTSRTPIREALNKLEQENLVSILPKKGVQVSPITHKRIMDTYQVRETLEPVALSRYGHRLQADQVRYFYDEITNSANHADVDNLDDEFHKWIITAYDNAYITELMETIQGHVQRIRIMCSKYTGQCHEFSQKEHLDILTSLRDGDYEQAGTLMREHIELSRQRTLESLFHG